MNIHKKVNINRSSTYNIGVSSCLLGHAVRYDGGHKYNSLIVTELEKECTLIPFCPEVAIGMGVPRPPICLVTINNNLHAINKADKANFELDYTQQLSSQANKYLADNVRLHGYIFQEKSPSCGIASTKVYDNNGALVSTQGSGIFVKSMTFALPKIPVIEACDLNSRP